MKIEHLAIWVHDLEKIKNFYTTYFDVSAGDKYINPRKQFTSYFLYFGSDKTRLEIMHRPDIEPNPGKRGFLHGVAHFAISIGNKQGVDALTDRLRSDGYTIESEPRTTGDGYYESVVLDPEGNYVEISA
ncbi:glyoxalase/bleomycin resistance/extradiol dioxygenase family protein [Rhodocytophaga rosea]|uniref:Glyoxalase/bleomycin resistance/extradiol dioxygenase family protein n=1 Tax=Rhodocytophaga rosea TaxID=2704465 RepID=A0A6C0GR18_9BACT|nr:VOC family protein [Rhodocytophaga rosea]QHT69950.1 glyoxalase/bleomycin resistance/extradiol dioxygenase family protein [Rhodocytophaga rosea]